ncbi:hypothetical protein ACHAWU_002020 [Discostella pseudostelligera]|uniref:Uncharacterized protein n=1 Tax=Discostella pseudostelligera TaxID=259834 RepID=A0ABD3MYS7_9STRA
MPNNFEFERWPRPCWTALHVIELELDNKCSETMAPAAAAAAAAGDDANTNRQHCYYNGVDTVPCTVTHLKVDPSVKVIPPASCLHCVRLVEVELPDGLEKIGSRAFSNCLGLESIDIPSTVTEIGERAFQHCCSLKVITLPQSLLKLGEEAFEDCRALETVHIPPLIQTIEAGTFSGCMSLANAILPLGLQEIKESAFQSCEALLSIDIPSSLRVIGKLAFHRAGLTEMHLPDSIEDCGTFKDYHFQNLRMPPRITKFDTGIFEVRGDNRIISIELPENIKQVIYPDSVKARLPALFNIAFPFGCSVDIGNVEASERDSLYDTVFRLQHRFDRLPLHKICYYHSYHDTTKVLLDMKRAMFPRSTKSHCGKLSAIGKHRDFNGMTPLHILACSTKHNLEMYQLLVGAYPEILIVKENIWGELPLFYAFRCNAPIEIIQFLVESYKANYPTYELAWECMVQKLIGCGAPLPRTQILLDIHEQSYPDQKLNTIGLVIGLAHALDVNEVKVPMERLRFLLHASIAKRLDSLNVTRWKMMYEERINLITRKPGKLEENALELYAALRGAEAEKESTTLLELALWKAALADAMARIDAPTYRNQCRINCGAEIVIPNVLHFLWGDRRNDADCVKGPSYDCDSDSYPSECDY